MNSHNYSYASRQPMGRSSIIQSIGSKEKDFQQENKRDNSKINYYIIAGHGGQDSGAIGLGGVKESDLTIELRDLICKDLRRYTPYVFSDENFLTLGGVISWVNRHANDSDIILDIHFNASDNRNAHGTEVFVASNASPREIAIANTILEVTSKELYTYNRGLKVESESPRGRIGILHAVGLNILLEVCFMTNQDDLSNYHARKASLAIALAQSLAGPLVA